MTDASYLVPTVIESSNRGERAYDIYSRLRRACGVGGGLRVRISRRVFPDWAARLAAPAVG